MALLGPKEQEFVREFFKALVNPVKLLVFTQEFECQFCKETHALVEELAALSDLVEAEVWNFVTDREKADAYGVDKIPAIVVLGPEDKDYGIRFFGIPSGYEFPSLLETIVAVSKGESGLSEESKKRLAELTQPVDIKVFITPTCPYCPMAVQLAHKMAIESDLIRSAMIEAIEFPNLANKYSVQGVPRTVINDTFAVEGAVPEAALVPAIVDAVSKGGATA